MTPNLIFKEQFPEIETGVASILTESIRGMSGLRLDIKGFIKQAYLSKVVFSLAVYVFWHVTCNHIHQELRININAVEEAVVAGINRQVLDSKLNFRKGRQKYGKVS